MGKFDDKLQELISQGLDPSIAEELRDASGLRQELNQATSQAQQAQSQNQDLMARLQRLEDKTWNSELKSMGVTVNPAILARPSDLDVTNEDALRKWALDNGLVPSTPTGEGASQLATQDQIATLGSGSDTPPAPTDQAKAAVLNAQTEEEFYKAAEAAGLT